MVNNVLRIPDNNNNVIDFEQRFYNDLKNYQSNIYAVDEEYENHLIDTIVNFSSNLKTVYDKISVEREEIYIKTNRKFE